jgi:hypothetical protein
MVYVVLLQLTRFRLGAELSAGRHPDGSWMVMDLIDGLMDDPWIIQVGP